MTQPRAYAQAGVDIEAGDRAVELMKSSIKATSRPEVLGGIGGFAGLFDMAGFKNYRRPVLCSSTDGVGTKVAIAQAMDRHDTIGRDLVGMLVDDLVVSGAEPLFMTDYIACGKVVPERIADIVKGIADGCVLAGCALIGGETAEHPGLMEADEYDIAGATTGIVEYDQILGAERVVPGDVIVAIASSGLHSNGYSLVRKVLLNDTGWKLDRHLDELGKTLGEELLIPTRIYAKDMLDVIAQCEVHSASHITGGGFANNLARVIPDGCGVHIERHSWMVPAIFRLVMEVGRLGLADVEESLNMGVGMALVMPASDATKAVEMFESRQIPAWVCGEVVATPGAKASVELVGSYA